MLYGKNLRINLFITQNIIWIKLSVILSLYYSFPYLDNKNNYSLWHEKAYVTEFNDRINTENKNVVQLDYSKGMGLDNSIF